MKKLIYILFVLPLLFTCSSDTQTATDDTPEVTIDPTIIAEYHVINSLNAIASKYIFDDSGRFFSYQNVAANYILNFNYDSESKITSVVKTDMQDNTLSTHAITYNLEDKITNIDDHNYVYNGAVDFYYDEGSYHESSGVNGDYLYTEIQYDKFFQSENQSNTIIQYCSYTYESIYDIVNESYIEEYTYCSPELFGGACLIGFDGANVTSTYCSAYHVFEDYDNNINPLYNVSSNLKTAYNFLKMLSIIDDSFEFNLILSQNNLIQFTLDVEAEQYYIYNYQLNDLNRPFIASRQYYEFGNPSGDENPNYARYYYQGDIIPD